MACIVEASPLSSKDGKTSLQESEYGIKDGDQITIIDDEGTLRIVPLLDIDTLRANSYSVAEIARVQGESRKDELEREG